MIKLDELCGSQKQVLRNNLEELADYIKQSLTFEQEAQVLKDELTEHLFVFQSPVEGPIYEPEVVAVYKQLRQGQFSLLDVRGIEAGDLEVIEGTLGERDVLVRVRLDSSEIYEINITIVSPEHGGSGLDDQISFFSTTLDGKEIESPNDFCEWQLESFQNNVINCYKNLLTFRSDFAQDVIEGLYEEEDLLEDSVMQSLDAVNAADFKHLFERWVADEGKAVVIDKIERFEGVEGSVMVYVVNQMMNFPANHGNGVALLSYLLEAGFDVNKPCSGRFNESALHGATNLRSESAKVCELLLINGANPGLLDSNGMSAIEITHMPQVKTLIESYLIKDSVKDKKARETGCAIGM